jgi:DNA helicase II / ATP-dependent DNA helicase PcrA
MLNPEQQIIINEAKGKCAVLAGAGSGKTFSLVEFVAKLHKAGIPLNRIFCSTFTNKAGGELKERIGKKLGIKKRELEDLWIGTSHALGIKYLQELGLDFRILDESERTFFLKKSSSTIIEQQNVEPVTDLFDIISYKRSRNCNWIEAGKKFGLPDERMETVKAIYKHFKKFKFAHSYLDFDDILYYFAAELKANNTKFRWVIFDEAQDLSVVQHDIAELLTNKNSLFVGDQKQSIYAWRGAAPELFDKKAQEADKVFTLSENYRSTGNIINFANAFVGGTVFEKQQLKATKDFGHEVEHYTCQDQLGVLMANIQNDLRRYPFDEIAILGRSVKGPMFSQLQFLLRQHKIPYVVRGGFDFLTLDYVQKYLAIVKSLSVPTLASVTNALDCIYGVGDVYAAKIAPALMTMKISEVNAVKLPKRVDQNALNLFFGLYSDRSKDVVLEKSLQFLETAWLKRKHADHGERADKISKIKSRVIEFLKESKSLKKGINDLTLTNDSDKEEQKAAVVISTIHQAKALEWGSVHLMNFQEGSMPNPRSDDPREEWCIAYTAITRAKTNLRLYRSVVDHRGARILDSEFLGPVDKKLYKRIMRAPGYHEPRTERLDWDNDDDDVVDAAP